MPAWEYEIRIRGRIGPALRAALSDFAVTTKPAETVLFGQFTTRQRCTGCWTGSTNWASRWLSSDSGPRPAGASALLDDGRPPSGLRQGARSPCERCEVHVDGQVALQ
jgi:hypothetical protein